MTEPIDQTRTSTACRAALGLLLALAAGCAATQQAPVAPQTYSGFLGNYGLLQKGGAGQADLRYVDPNARWTSYDKILLEPVTFWGDDKTKVSAADQSALCNYLYSVLKKDLSTRYPMVEEPGPGVLKIMVAITDVSAATPVLRTISTVVPQAKALNTLKYLATGSYAFVGGAQAEAKLTDSQTGEILGEFIDHRIGTGSVKAAVQWEWGDADDVFRLWAKASTERLYSWTSGAASPA